MPLSPALQHYLMVGATESHFVPGRLPGWFPALTEIVPDTTALSVHWCAHRETLTAEALAAGFTPVATRWFDDDDQRVEDVDDVPQDANPARAAWSAAFCRRWGY